MTKEQLWEDVLRHVQKPGRYIGGEWHAVRKDPASVSFKMALAFPDLYEVGMSHMGQKILYHLLNRLPDVLAERVYAPWVDLEQQLRKHRLALGSIENRIPLCDFDVVGFSLLYELNYTNLLTMLDLGGIPLLSRNRDSGHPLVIAGGPAAFNPEPLADFIDAFAIGDGEEILPELIGIFRGSKAKQGDRNDLLRELSGIQGLYVPDRYRVERSSPDGLRFVRPLPGAPMPIRKRCLESLDDIPFPEDIIVPNIDIVFDRVSVEAARGCPQNCRFCQARSLYFPERLRAPDRLFETVLGSVRSTGFEDASLAALSIGDYPGLQELIGTLMDGLDGERVSLSLSSLRPKGLTRRIAETILRVRKTGFTLVPEAGTDRLRAVINKHLTDAEIQEAVDTAFSNGWRKLKLYFMVGLPTETTADVEGIVETVRWISQRGRAILRSPPQINLSVASFIPKPHTPFQWAAMDGESDLHRKHDLIRAGLRRYRNVRFKPHSLENSLLEGVFSRGDRRLGPVLMRAWNSGARFDSWTERFNFGLWQAAFAAEGVEPGSYLGELDRKAVLPWDHLDTGIRKDLLLKEFELARRGERTPPCRTELCSDCRGCQIGRTAGSRREALAKISPPSVPPPPATVGEDVPPRRYRVSFAKTGPARFLSHRDVGSVLQRSFRRAGVRVAHSRGFHPKMIVSYAPALPLGMAGLREAMDFKSPETLSTVDFPAQLNAVLPDGIVVLELEELGSSQLDLNRAITFLSYDLSLDDPLIRERLAAIRSERDDPLLDDVLLAESLIEAYREDEDEERRELLLKLDREGRSVQLQVPFRHQKPFRAQDIMRDLFGLEEAPVFAMTRTGIRLRDTAGEIT